MRTQGPAAPGGVRARAQSRRQIRTGRSRSGVRKMSAEKAAPGSPEPGSRHTGRPAATLSRLRSTEFSVPLNGPSFLGSIT